jgi:CheY-like chemotaxis protein/HPt (histidine-containing phosphotransfer) domain-containing protein
MVDHDDTSKVNLLLGKQLPLQILLVEDTVVNQKFALLVLKKIGYQADVVVNITEAITALTRAYYDILLIDARLLEKFTTEMSRYFHQQPNSLQYPYIIAMTTNPQHVGSYHLEIHVDDYINKPIRMEELVQALNKWKTRTTSTDKKLPNSVDQESSHRESDSSVIDIIALQALKNMLGGDTQAFTEVISCYLSESPKLLQLISTSSTNQDAQTLWQTAHKFKSSSASIGAKIIAQLCLQIEAKGQTGNLVGSAEIVAQLYQEYEQVKIALEKINS